MGITCISLFTYMNIYFLAISSFYGIISLIIGIIVKLLQYLFIFYFYKIICTKWNLKKFTLQKMKIKKFKMLYEDFENITFS